MDLVVFAGGLGTRLRGVEPDRPKPVVDVAGKPFLFHLLSSLPRGEFGKIHLSIGHKSEVVIDLMDDYRGQLFDDYFIERDPLGTGGVLCEFARNHDHDFVAYMNGDTFFDDFNLFDFSIDDRVSGKVFVTRVADVDRYGAVSVDNSGFLERFCDGGCGEGLVNIGVGVISLDVLRAGFPRDRHISLEKDVYPILVKNVKIAIEEISTDFIDIGVPSDLARFRERYA